MLYELHLLRNRTESSASLQPKMHSWACVLATRLSSIYLIQATRVRPIKTQTSRR